VRKSEGRLKFDFKTALSVERPEELAQPFKCADFIVQEIDATWLIEVTDVSRLDDKNAIANLLGQWTSGYLLKDMLMKQYGTHAYLAHIKETPAPIVFFCVVIGLRPQADAAQRSRMRDEMKRITDKIGPSFHGTTNRPIIKVESIESWNKAHPNVQIA